MHGIKAGRVWCAAKGVEKKNTRPDTGPPNGIERRLSPRRSLVLRDAHHRAAIVDKNKKEA